MSPRYVAGAVILVVSLVGSVLYHAGVGPFAGASLLDERERSAIETLVESATSDIAQAAPAACRTALARSATGALDDDGQVDCTAALAVLTDEEARSLGAAVIEKSRGSLALTLALEMASTHNHAAAWFDVAVQLRAAAGPVEADYQQLDPSVLAAAHAAAQRAAAAGSPRAGALLREMEAVEFPLRGAPYEPLWRSLYFGRFAEIEDTVHARHLVTGMAYALGDLCAQWEPPGIRSVAFTTGFETYLAPLRAQVPGRIAASLPKVGSALVQSYEETRGDGGERSAEDWLADGFRAFQRVRKVLQNGVALGSVAGRDSAQMLFNAVQSCRSPRGGKFIRNLTRYFQYTANAQPSPGAAAR